MNGAKIKRSEIELCLRDMTNYIIGDNAIVKSIVDDVFQEVNINSLHKRYKTKDEVKIELVSFTRNKILEYLDTYSTVEKYSEIKESLNHYAKKYVKYNMYFCRDGAPSIEKYIGVQEHIDREIDKLTTIEKEVLVRRYYFFQSSEKIAQSLDISTYKVYSIMKQLVKSLWSKVNINADMEGDSPVDVSSLQKDMDVFFTNIANQNKGFSKQKIAEKEIKEYFLVKMLSNSKVNDIDIIFDDICLESMSNVRPNDEEIDNLKYLRIYIHHHLTSTSKK